MPVQIKLSWTPSPAEEQVFAYHVHESVNGSGFAVIGTTKETSFEVTRPDTDTYDYRVTAQNATGTSELSEVSKAPPTPKPVGSVLASILKVEEQKQ